MQSDLPKLSFDVLSYEDVLFPTTSSLDIGMSSYVTLAAQLLAALRGVRLAIAEVLPEFTRRFHWDLPAPDGREMSPKTVLLRRTHHPQHVRSLLGRGRILVAPDDIPVLDQICLTRCKTEQAANPESLDHLPVRVA